MLEEQLAIEFLQKLLDGSRGVIVLAEDAEGASWRVVTNEELQVLRPITRDLLMPLLLPCPSVTTWRMRQRR